MGTALTEKYGLCRCNQSTTQMGWDLGRLFLHHEWHQSLLCAVARLLLDQESHSFAVLQLGVLVMDVLQPCRVEAHMLDCLGRQETAFVER